MALEIERKFLVKGARLQELRDALVAVYAHEDDGYDIDHYFKAPKKLSVVRLRELSEGYSLTIKAPTDKHHTRHEYELDVCEDGRQLIEFMYGKSVLTLEKEYSNYSNGDTLISVASVINHHVYLEVEGTSIAEVNRVLKGVKKALKDICKLKEEKRSLFEIYRPKKQAKVAK